VFENIEVATLEVLKQYPIKRAAFFGSAARQDMTENSDVDLIIEFLPHFDGLDFFGLRIDLEEAIGRSVDLITWNSLSRSKTGFKEGVERDMRLIYGH